MNYYKLFWIIFSGVLINTWRDIISFYWYRCTYIGGQNLTKK